MMAVEQHVDWKDVHGGRIVCAGGGRGRRGGNGGRDVMMEKVAEKILWRNGTEGARGNNGS